MFRGEGAEEGKLGSYVHKMALRKRKGGSGLLWKTEAAMEGGKAYKVRGKMKLKRSD